MNENNLEKIINNIVGDAIVKEVMSLKLAVKLIETVEEKAAEMGLAVVVVVSDASGRRKFGARSKLQEDLSLFIAWMVLIMAASMLQ